ncbi:hypothetical protein M885DRAFT_622917 [Pelagophyceae sp. CCMP2097]|nr:hypothetical protein M885DRAFT_622917 [Pelagophyceae sp. CCMP2097]
MDDDDDDDYADDYEADDYDDESLPQAKKEAARRRELEAAIAAADARLAAAAAEQQRVEASYEQDSLAGDDYSAFNDESTQLSKPAQPPQPARQPEASEASETSGGDTAPSHSVEAQPPDEPANAAAHDDYSDDYDPANEPANEPTQPEASEASETSGGDTAPSHSVEAQPPANAAAHDDSSDDYDPADEPANEPAQNDYEPAPAAFEPAPEVDPPAAPEASAPAREPSEPASDDYAANDDFETDDYDADDDYADDEPAFTAGPLMPAPWLAAGAAAGASAAYEPAAAEAPAVYDAAAGAAATERAREAANEAAVAAAYEAVAAGDDDDDHDGFEELDDEKDSILQNDDDASLADGAAARRGSLSAQPSVSSDSAAVELRGGGGAAVVARGSGRAVPSAAAAIESNAAHDFVVERLQATNAQLRRQLREFRQLLRSSLEPAPGATPRRPAAAPAAATARRPERPVFSDPISRKQLALSQRKASAYLRDNQRLHAKLVAAIEAGSATASQEAAHAALELKLRRARDEARAAALVSKFQEKALTEKQASKEDHVLQRESLEAQLRVAVEERRRVESRYAQLQKKESAARAKVASLHASVEEVSAFAAGLQRAAEQRAVEHQADGKTAALEAEPPAGAVAADDADDGDTAAAPSPAMPRCVARAFISAGPRPGAMAESEAAKLAGDVAALQKALQRSRARKAQDGRRAGAAAAQSSAEVGRLEAVLALRDTDLLKQTVQVAKLKSNLKKLVDSYHKIKTAAKAGATQRSASAVLFSLLVDPPDIHLEKAPPLGGAAARPGARRLAADSAEPDGDPHLSASAPQQPLSARSASPPKPHPPPGGPAASRQAAKPHARPVRPAS